MLAHTYRIVFETFVVYPCLLQVCALNQIEIFIRVCSSAAFTALVVAIEVYKTGLLIVLLIVYVYPVFSEFVNEIFTLYELLEVLF